MASKAVLRIALLVVMLALMASVISGRSYSGGYGSYRRYGSGYRGSGNRYTSGRTSGYTSRTYASPTAYSARYSSPTRSGSRRTPSYNLPAGYDSQSSWTQADLEMSKPARDPTYSGAYYKKVNGKWVYYPAVRSKRAIGDYRRSYRHYGSGYRGSGNRYTSGRTSGSYRTSGYSPRTYASPTTYSARYSSPTRSGSRRASSYSLPAGYDSQSSWTQADLEMSKPARDPTYSGAYYKKVNGKWVYYPAVRSKRATRDYSITDFQNLISAIFMGKQWTSDQHALEKRLIPEDMETVSKAKEVISRNNYYKAEKAKQTTPAPVYARTQSDAELRALVTAFHGSRPPTMQQLSTRRALSPKDLARYKAFDEEYKNRGKQASSSVQQPVRPPPTTTCNYPVRLRLPKTINWASDGALQNQKLSDDLYQGGFFLSMGKPAPGSINTRDAFDFNFADRIINVRTFNVYSEGQDMKKVAVQYRSNNDWHFINDNSGSVKIFDVEVGRVPLLLPPTSWIRIFPQDWAGSQPYIKAFAFDGCEA